jgi:hypothetical protein
LDICPPRRHAAESKPKVVARELELDVSVDRLRDAFVQQFWSEHATHPAYGERATQLAAIAKEPNPRSPTLALLHRTTVAVS